MRQDNGAVTYQTMDIMWYQSSWCRADSLYVRSVLVSTRTEQQTIWIVCQQTTVGQFASKFSDMNLLANYALYYDIQDLRIPHWRPFGIICHCRHACTLRAALIAEAKYFLDSISKKETIKASYSICIYCNTLHAQYIVVFAFYLLYDM